MATSTVTDVANVTPSFSWGIKLISRSHRQSAAIAIGGGTATLLLMAAWNNLEPWTIGRAVVPLRPPLYVTFLLLFLVMMSRAGSAAWTPCPPMMRARRPRALVPYVALVLAGVIPWFAGLRPFANSRVALNDSRLANLFSATPGGEIYRVFQPAWLRAFEESGGRYRPLMFLLVWVVNGLHGTGVALIGAHVGVGALILALLEGWGVRRWVATMAALSFVLHPVTVKYLQAMNIQYMWGALAFFGALYALQRWMDRPSAARLALVLALYGSSTLFSESWLGGSAVLISLLVAYRAGFRIDESVRPMPPTMLAIALILVVTALVIAMDIYAMDAIREQFTRVETPSLDQLFRSLWAANGRLPATPHGRRLLLNLLFEPYWPFLMPFESKTTVLQLVAAVSLASVPAMMLIRRARVGRQASVLWITASLSLGPVLMFFEMTPAWSIGHMAYGPCAVLTLCLGLIISETTSRRVARVWSTACCVSLTVLSLIQGAN